MTQVARKLYTPEEYFALEAKALGRSEYYQGEIFAMAGSSVNHNRLTRNICAALNQAFGSGPCEAFLSDLRLEVKEDGTYVYPNVLAICGELEFSKKYKDNVTNPKLIAEVLSDSTQIYDRNGKFYLYRELSSLEDYLLIDQTKVYVEYYHKISSKEWALYIYDSLTDVIDLQGVNIILPLAQIYQRVKFPSPASNNSTQA